MVRIAACDLVAAIDALPPLPGVAARVVRLCNDPRASAADLVTVVSADPGLTARLLRAANSSVYRRLGDVTSIQRAVMLIGFTQARNIALTGALAATFAPESARSRFRLSLFWRHSLAVAFRASDLARGNRQPDPAAAFTAGLLGNVGRLVIYNRHRSALERAVRLARSANCPIEAIERDLLGYDHAEAGGLLATNWGLPGEIAAAIACHHAPEAGSLASFVADAEAFCARNGLLAGYDAEAASADSPPDPEFSGLLSRVDTLMAAIATVPGVARRRAA